MSSGRPSWHRGWARPVADRDPFRVTVAHPGPGLAVVEVTGALDIATCPEFDVHLDDELHDPHRRVRDVIVDLTRLELMSAAGVRSVLGAEETARAEHVRLQMVITRPLVVRVITLFDVDGRLCVQPDLDSARRSAI
jgi:anti-anti-sigma factor